MSSKTKDSIGAEVQFLSDYVANLKKDISDIKEVSRRLKNTLEMLPENPLIGVDLDEFVSEVDLLDTEPTEGFSIVWEDLF